MPKLKASAEDIKGLPVMDAGIYTVRLKGFKPLYSDKKDSVNLNPQMEIVNHPEHNNRLVYETLNTKAKWRWKQFCECFGVEMQEMAGGDYEFPGTFDGPENDPTKWVYSGPLLGTTGQIVLKVAQVLDRVTKQPTLDRNGNPTRNEVEKYISAVGASQAASA